MTALPELVEPLITRPEVVAWVKENPGATSERVAAAFSTTVKIAGAHLERAVGDRSLTRHKGPPGARGRWVYGPPGWIPGVTSDTAPLLAHARGRLVYVRRELARLTKEERVLVRTIEGLEALDDTPEER